MVNQSDSQVEYKWYGNEVKANLFLHILYSPLEGVIGLCKCRLLSLIKQQRHLLK